MSVVVLYGRPGCCLCDDARVVLDRVRSDQPFELIERDIEGDDALLRRYLERIPVITLDGAELFDFAVDETVLRELLSKVPLMTDDLSGPAEEDLASSAERLSLGVAARLSRYLQVLTQARKMGRETISSHELADYTHVNSTQIRRDLSGFGKFGKRGVGYNVDSLLAQIRKILRTAGQHNIALFGAGHLGMAIASSEIFADHGFRVVAIFDSDQAKVGQRVGQHVVRHNDDLRSVVEEQDIVVGVLAVPTIAAQGLADDLVAAGVKIIFNYSDALLDVPPETTVHTSSPAVDLLYALYFYLA
jgi:redox-sensing transcriptional repressor